MSWIVVYAKIVDNRKSGLIMDGPTTSSIIFDKRSDAEAEARRLINESRGATVIPRLYEINNILEISAVIANANEYYKQMYNNMLEAKEVLSRPAQRHKHKNAGQYGR
ncbi:MAG: hypothetical protein QXU32_02045 [Nitrososphaerales archaeon]